MSDPEKKRSDHERDETQDIILAGIAGASQETVSLFGDAAKEYVVAYSGVDNAAGRELERSLKKIAGYNINVNPNDAARNIKQQAGFAAEVMSVADKNADAIIKGDSTRWSRSEDAGFGKNHEIADLVQLDKNGKPIPGTETQLKFVGSDPKEALGKLTGNKFQKYLDADAKIEVPSDHYHGIMDEADKQIRELRKQQANPEVMADSHKSAGIQEKIDRLEKIKTNLRESSLSKDDALFARQHPTLAAAQRVVSVSHQAGVQGAKYGAAIGGGVSVVKNAVALYKGDIEASEALANVAQDTAVASALGYGTSFAGTAIASVGKNASSGAIQSLANSSLPAHLVQASLTAGKTMMRYFNGEIDGAQCLEELGQGGANVMSSAVFGALGQAVIPIPIVGAMAGSMIGYALSSVSYGLLSASLKEAKHAREERMRIERECEEHIKMIREYRAEMESMIKEYLSSMRSAFTSAFGEIKKALMIGDVDGYIDGVNKITKALGGNVLFEDFDGFDKLMQGGGAIML